MPAYSFQERFVPLVLNGTKRQTIRTRREKGYAKKGDTLYLYFGLRTKYCRKLREEVCTDARSIAIDNSYGIVLFNRLLTRAEMQYAIENIVLTPDHLPQYNVLSSIERDILAYNDGFRIEGSSPEQPLGCFHLMLTWWRRTHELPFVGDIIFWEPTSTKHTII
ncbi:MAG: hypothetical protein M0Q26_06020 [Chitinophagaceae bacterium]|nr:hypothetical protein [Chitinophagaceae bacterium]MDP1763441.1 hypothetical protein [Sediminibacterium sp.]